MKNEISHHKYQDSHDQHHELYLITCSFSCDHEKHEKHGFCLNDFTNFNSGNIFSQINDNVKNYINNLSAIF